MTEEFRAAFQRVLDTAAEQAPGFSGAVHDVFRLSSQVPEEELGSAMEALAPVLADCESVAGIAADLAVLAGALVEAGAPAGQVGLEVLRQLGSYGQAAVAFMHAWEKTGGGTPPSPLEVGEAEEERVEEVLGENAPLATVGWWTSLRYGLAAKAMLGDSRVRAAVRSDAGALEGLGQIVHALSTRLPEFIEVGELLRMAEAEMVLVLDRSSWRGFRVRFDGIGDNFQLHTLLADALIGKEGRRLAGDRPDPRWTAACLDAQPDPLADVVRGEWDLVGGDGTWVGNEACPADIPFVDGERVLVLEPQTLTHSWRAGRRHPQIPGGLTILEELHPDEATAWWSRMHPAGSVRHPLAPEIDHGDTGSHRPPRHFGVAAHFEEVDSGPMSSTFSALDAETAAAEETDPEGGAESWAEAYPREAVGWVDEPASEPEPWPLPASSEPWSSPSTPESGLEPEPWTAQPSSGSWPVRSSSDPWAAEPAPEPRGCLPPDDGRPPGAHLMPPLPPGVSESWAWAPEWKWPPPPATDSSA
ncbi:hypothetical protein PWG71_27330 [Nocardiopsis sp. N85]|uniref:hypothetical protein n=1 Tax=Nocardiopsis sp. N85 TaxID=3029400 RepID=UPI00237F2488|nr:hypothetical protein [Nocardiopsis sp. N85]MDE3725111.1 hypothetical protein [Nocardiopsis sp. N85]